MTILITAPNQFIGDGLEVGRYYSAESADDPTERQNRAFHALLQEYWRSGCHSYNARNFPHFRALVKLYLGAGTEKYYSLVNGDGSRCPEGVVGHRLKSWSKYTKRERTETIDRLIAEMHQAGVQSKKFYKILEGMECEKPKPPDAEYAMF